MGVKNLRFVSFQSIEPGTVMKYPLVIVKIRRCSTQTIDFIFTLVTHPFRTYLKDKILMHVFI